MLYLIAMLPGLFLVLFLLGVSAFAALGAKLINLVCEAVYNLTHR